jgi:hypothetical protein
MLAVNRALRGSIICFLNLVGEYENAGIKYRDKLIAARGSGYEDWQSRVSGLPDSSFWIHRRADCGGVG